MMNTVANIRMRTGVAIVAEFVVFFGLLFLLPVVAGYLPEKQAYTATLVVAIAFMVLILLTVLHSLRQQEGRIASLADRLALERSESEALQTQFAEAIEKRTFELQRVNGALNREIAERTQAEGEVRGLQKQLSLILNSAGEGILGLDNNGKVIFMNTAASLMLGWEADELLGNTHHQYIHHTHPDGTPHPVEACPIHMAYRDGRIHYKTGDVFWNKSGTSFPVEYVSTPIRDDGMLTGAVVVFRDMNTFT